MEAKQGWEVAYWADILRKRKGKVKSRGRKVKWRKQFDVGDSFAVSIDKPRKATQPDAGNVCVCVISPK